jgi:hypothetical protein
MVYETGLSAIAWVAFPLLMRQREGWERAGRTVRGVGRVAPRPDTIGVYAKIMDYTLLSQSAIFLESWSGCK